MLSSSYHGVVFSELLRNALCWAISKKLRTVAIEIDGFLNMKTICV